MDKTRDELIKFLEGVVFTSKWIGNACTTNRENIADALLERYLIVRKDKQMLIGNGDIHTIDIFYQGGDKSRFHPSKIGGVRFIEKEDTDEQ